MINKIKYLFSFGLVILFLNTEANAQPVVSTLLIQNWCPANYPNQVQDCLDGVLDSSIYPAGIVWGTYGRFRGGRGGFVGGYERGGRFGRDGGRDKGQMGRGGNRGREDGNSGRGTNRGGREGNAGRGGRR
jgi:hypothetical protein